MKKSVFNIVITLCLAVSMTLTAFAAEFVFTEAEVGKIDGMTAVSDAQAHGGKYLTSDDLEQGADYTFDIPKDGQYTAWFRVYATSDTDNSIFFSVDGDTYEDGTQWIFDFRESSEYEVSPDEKYLDPDYNNAAVCYNRWYWIRMNYRDAVADPVTRFNTKLYNFKAGAHTMHIQSREAGARIDKIFFTDDIAYNPNNVTGDPETVILAAAAPVVEIKEPTAPESAVTAEANTPVASPVVSVSPNTGGSLNFLLFIFSVSSALLIAMMAKTRKTKR